MINIGDYKLSSIETGEFALDGGAMFGIVPKPLWERCIGVDSRNRIDLNLRVLLAQGRGRNILVETGIGNKGDAKFNDIYRVNNSRYDFEKSLNERGLGRKDITDVIVTHLHFDHAGGATWLNPDGEIVPSFPNATYYIQKKQYERALGAKERDAASFRIEDFNPLFEKGVVELLDGEFEIEPGLEIVTTNGHTDSQQHLLVSDGKTTLFHCADMIPTSVHIGLPWIMGYDLRPLETLEERRKILEQAVKEGWILFFGHCPHMPAAKVKFENGHYKISEKINM